MAAEDMKDEKNRAISRLEYTKKYIQDTLENNKNKAIITYARVPTLYLPFVTDDRRFIDAVTSIEVEEDYGGSDLTLALALVKELYEKDSSIDLSIFTDGWSTTTLEFPTLPRSWSVTLVGVGTEGGGPIPLGYNADGTRRYKYFSWSEVVARYERWNIESFSDTLGASVYRMWNGPSSKNIIDLSKNTLPPLALIFLFVGVLTFPYARKKSFF
jgi:hypothetical protein